MLVRDAITRFIQRAYPRCLSTSSWSGKRPSLNLEKMTLLSRVTSKAPPPEGMNSRLARLYSYSLQHFFRQTDGFREVASRGAVFDAETVLLGHGCAPFCAVLRLLFRSFLSMAFPGALRSMVGACRGLREIDSRPASSSGQTLRGNYGETIARLGSLFRARFNEDSFFRLGPAGAVIGNNLQVLHSRLH